MRVISSGYCTRVRLTRQQLALEAQSISTRAATLTKDGFATAAGFVIFWPAAFFVGGDKQTTAELSQMKGQMVAVEQASIAKKCNMLISVQK